MGLSSSVHASVQPDGGNCAKPCTRYSFTTSPVAVATASVRTTPNTFLPLMRNRTVWPISMLLISWLLPEGAFPPRVIPLNHGLVCHASPDPGGAGHTTRVRGPSGQTRLDVTRHGLHGRLAADLQQPRADVHGDNQRRRVGTEADDRAVRTKEGIGKRVAVGNNDRKGQQHGRLLTEGAFPPHKKSKS